MLYHVITMTQKIIQIGNSTGVIIPKSLLIEIGLTQGSQVIIEKDPLTKSLSIRKKGEKSNRSSLSPRFLQLLDEVNTEYGSVLQELASK